MGSRAAGGAAVGHPATRPFLNYLMLSGQLHPGYDYLVERKLAAVLREAPGSMLGEQRERFLAAAAELGYRPRAVAGMCSQAAMRLLIQSGRPLTGLTDDDLRELDDAITAREQARGQRLQHYRIAVTAARAVIYHMGAPVTPPAGTWRRAHLRWDWARHFDGRPGRHRRVAVRLPRMRGRHPEPRHGLAHGHPAGPLRPHHHPG